jgi:malonyl-CoA/methylmalonyl-CoA synthetase
LLGIWRAGLVAVPLTRRHPERLRASLLEDAGAEMIITDPLSIRGRETTLPSPPEPDGVAMLLYTSGTTGKPKGAMLTHHNLAAGARALASTWKLHERRALLHCLPLHHMHGIAIALLPCLAAGMSCVMLPRFDAERVWTHIARAPEGMGAIDTFMAVPTMYHRLLSTYDDADSATRRKWAAGARALSLATSGSAALPQGLAARWEELTGAIPLERWGMTEVGVGLSNSLDPRRRRRGWVGKPVAGIDTKVEDDGELLVRGPSVFVGYWERPDATEEAFDGPWFRTGDIVTRDDEGMFRIVGRRSVDIIKSGGYKISALEIEEHLRDQEAIEDAAVVGIPDPVYGERVAAAIVVRSGATVNEETLTAWLRDRIAPYQLPRAFRFVSELPTNPVGKVQKPRVKELFA